MINLIRRAFKCNDWHIFVRTSSDAILFYVLFQFLCWFGWIIPMGCLVNAPSMDATTLKPEED